MPFALSRSGRLQPAANLVPAVLAAILAGLLPVDSPSGATVADDRAPALVPSTTARHGHPVRIVLRVADGQATATLDDSPAARRFAAMLPLQLRLHDGMGQAKIAQLPATIDVSDAHLVTDPDTAAIYYWPPTGAIGIYYDDIGQTVPPRGMVRLGAVTTGLDAIASAGNRLTIRSRQDSPEASWPD